MKKNHLFSATSKILCISFHLMFNKNAYNIALMSSSVAVFELAFFLSRNILSCLVSMYKIILAIVMLLLLLLSPSSSLSPLSSLFSAHSSNYRRYSYKATVD